MEILDRSSCTSSDLPSPCRLTKEKILVGVLSFPLPHLPPPTQIRPLIPLKGPKICLLTF
ncbi:hypothetical protein JB92DRAFT_2975582, partial [Gautieria morchelliformis]